VARLSFPGGVPNMIRSRNGSTEAENRVGIIMIKSPDLTPNAPSRTSKLTE
jgi:hypothetical protein